MKLNLKKKGLEEAGIIALGGLVGYSLREWGMRAGLVGAALAPKKYRPFALGVFAGGTSGAAAPSSGNFKEDAISNAKGYVKGALKGVFVDKIAPQVLDKLDGLGLGSLEENFDPVEDFIRDNLNQSSPSAKRLMQQASNLGNASVAALRLQSAMTA